MAGENRRAIWRWAVVGLIIVILFPLSAGPLEWVAAHGWVDEDTLGDVAWIYGPVWWAADETGLDTPLMNYLIWWSRLGP